MIWIKFMTRSLCKAVRIFRGHGLPGDVCIKDIDNCDAPFLSNAGQKIKVSLISQ